MCAMFGVVCFPELGQDTGRCKTQIVVLSIVHETQTQNYNVTFSFVCNTRTNKQRFLIPKLAYIQRFIGIEQALLVEWLKSTPDNSIVVGSSPTVYSRFSVLARLVLPARLG